jgi:hypothetical protein
MTKWQRAGIKLVFAFAIALIVNWALLQLLGQKSTYRAEHSLVGVVFLMAYVFLFRTHNGSRTGSVGFFFGALLPCYCGTVFPDFDITLFGIGGHRNPLFHSCLSYYALFWLVKGWKHTVTQPLVIGYGIGLASHLWWDVFDHGDVRWLPGSMLDRLWLGVNGIGALIPLRHNTQPSQQVKIGKGGVL